MQPGPGTGDRLSYHSPRQRQCNSQCNVQIDRGAARLQGREGTCCLLALLDFSATALSDQSGRWVQRPLIYGGCQISSRSSAHGPRSPAHQVTLDCRLLMSCPPSSLLSALLYNRASIPESPGLFCFPNSMSLCSNPSNLHSQWPSRSRFPPQACWPCLPCSSHPAS